MSKKRVAIIGAGIMGLSAAHECLKNGYSVTVYEKLTAPGGMASHFQLGDVSIEKFYHFICKSDVHTFELLKELGIFEELCWRSTEMGYFVDGKEYDWGTPLSLLQFPKLTFLEKINYAYQMFKLTKLKNFEHIEHLDAKTWIKQLFGTKVYYLLFKNLLDLKFFQYSDIISASWIATRIKRVGNSRKSIFQESLGYIRGGSQTLVNALVDKITKDGGNIICDINVEQVKEYKTGVHVSINDKFEYFDHAIMTIPTPHITKVVPSLSQAEKNKFNAIKNIGVVCVLLELKKKVTKKFWLNICDKKFEIPGIIEFSNLRDVGSNIVYVPYYMPITNEKFNCSDKEFISESLKYLKTINPLIAKDDIINYHVGRLKYSQPICTPNFKKSLPAVNVSVRNVQIADTCYYYPEDRGFSESIRFGKMMANNIKNN
jgi:protoporphyrinogen oxidase